MTRVLFSPGFDIELGGKDAPRTYRQWTLLEVATAIELGYRSSAWGPVMAQSGLVLKQGGRSSGPTYRKIALNVSEPVYTRLEEMADDRGGIPIAELVRRALITFDHLDKMMKFCPAGTLELRDPAQPGVTHPVHVPIGNDAL